MIEFRYTQVRGYVGNDPAVQITVQTDAEHMAGLVHAFRQFLIHVGYHPDTVAALVFQDEKPDDPEALPQQFDWVDDYQKEQYKAGSTD